MRLHLPKALLAAVLAACLAWPAGASTLTSETTTIGGVKYSGYVIEYVGTSNQNFHQGTYATTTTATDTTETEITGKTLTITNASESTSSTQFDAYSDGSVSTTAKQDLWKLFCSNSTFTHGHTLKLNSSASTNLTLTCTFKPITIGGLISTGSASSYTLTTDTSTRDIELTGNSTSRVNMAIGVNTTLNAKTGAISINTGGSWVISKGKSLTLSSTSTNGVTIASGQNVNVSASGDGTGNASLTFSGAVTNNGTLNIGSNVLFSASNTITNTGNISFASGATINLDSLASTFNLSNAENGGVQTYSKSWTLASGGAVDDKGATYKFSGSVLTGSMTDGVFSTESVYSCYNVASGITKTYTEVTTDIGTSSVDFINVLGTLEGVSADEDQAKAMKSIMGTGKVLVNGTLEYGKPQDGSITFLNEFEGTLEIGNGGLLKLGYTSTQLGKLSALKVTEGGKIGGWNKTNESAKAETKPSGVTLELAGGTLTTAGGNLVYGGAIKVTENSYFDISANSITITGDLKIDANKSISVNSGTNTKLNHDGFAYVGTTITALTSVKAFSLFDNATVTNGTLTQTENANLSEQYKVIGVTLTNVKLVNTATRETRLTANDTLSAIDIGGKLVVKSDTSVSGVASVTGTLEVDSGKSLKLTGQNTTSSIATLTGSGTLKTTGGTTTVTNASGFSGTLEATTGGSLEANGTTTGASGTVTLSSLAGLKATGGSIELTDVAATLTVTDLVVAGNGSISGAESYMANKVSIGAGEAGSLVGNLSIQDGGTITLDASAGATTETGGTKGLGLSLSSPLTNFADEGSATTTGSLTLGSGLTLNLANLGRLARGESLTLFSGVTEVIGLTDENLTALEQGTLAAEDVFSSGVGTGNYNLRYSGNVVSIVAQKDTPEPTTATLSLLALMALAARRRRKA